MSRVRCAIYTRKSSDEGLDQAFNSLDAQREACEAYIQSQRHEGWKILREHYDDGGISGGTMDRPGLQRLLAEIEAGRIDMVVVYKIDRLTRSLADFARLVETLEAAGTSFVSVTQQFNTSTSMGRLTLNVLLSFAQFEREVTAERIRDKIAASKKKGLWMGGFLPLGYDKRDAGLVINKSEARTVTTLFEKYLELGNVRQLKDFADVNGLTTKQHTFTSGRAYGGKPFSRGHLYQLLSNPIYRGKIRHRDKVHDGQHEAIIPEDLWHRVQAQLEANRHDRKSGKNTANPSPLAGKVFDETGHPFTASHARKGERRYRYYVSRDREIRLPARELERTVREALDQNIRMDLDPDASVTNSLEKIQRVIIGNETVALHLAGVDEIEPIQITYTQRRRGVERKLVLDRHLPSRKIDKVLIRRIVRAMSWLEAIKAGQSISEIAKEQDISATYITHNIDLAFLSPRVLDAISGGRQAPHVSAYQLSKISIPVKWEHQDAIFLS
ncbi:recombinase family protein [Henriciella sp.]|uniref:recombinase family protein n=1 Tax=Henriciella sp. TaxID=1968823 RepID=UPI00261137D8|nr:recombinase family protein [Henriciella sp.]